jgi:tripeptidyl-peptidase-1
MGFLNPFLYANPQAFTDVTVGSDKVGRGGDTLEYGFDCAKGWDPVTGLGTPKFAELLKAAMK